jgi:DNA repair exonuclease SbcCD ATPase subunit
MNKQYIKSISIEGFRGINNENNPLQLDFNTKGITSIFAPNGIGKSSIFDVLSFCLNGDLKCLEPLKHDNKDYKSIQNIFHSGDGKIIITIEDDSGNLNLVEFKIDNNGDKELISTNPDLPSILENIKDIHNFLDYNAFANIIYSNQEDAGKLFLRLIGYESFSELQEKLTSLSRTQNLSRDFQVEAKKEELESNKEKIDTLKDLIIENIKSVGLKNKFFISKVVEKSCLNGINKLASVNELSFLNIKINDIINEVNNKNDSFNKAKEELVKNTQEKEKLNIHSNKIQFFSNSKFERVKRELERAYNKLENENDTFIGELYEKALNVYSEFKEINNNSCVLCKTEDLGTTKQSFVQKLENNNNKFISFKEKYLDFKIIINNYIDNSTLREIEEILFAKKVITNKIITDFYYSQTILTIKQFDEHKFLELIQFYSLEIKKQIANLATSINKIKESIPAELHTIITKLTYYKTIQESIIEISELEITNKKTIQYIKYAEKWTQFIITVKDKFISKNNFLIKEISNDISENTQSFFQEIMNSPEIIPKIEKKDSGQKVLMLLEKFYSESDKKAAPLLSESNRNALCLSIYFACALNISKSGFIVLDDITSSFDCGHQSNLLLLLKNKVSRIHKAKGKQIIILTHDGELEKSLKKYSSEMPQKWNHYILQKESNIKVDKNEICINEIASILKLKANNGDNIGNEIRKYFERVLLEIHRKLCIPMNYDLANHRDKRMLQALITNLRNMLKLYRSASGYQVISALPSDSDFIDILDLKDKTNQISHYESDNTSSHTPEYIIGIIEKIEAFNQMFQYNCTCTEINGGMTYYARVNSKKVKNCKCSI